MSLILDALNKADDERQRDDAPSLASRHSPSPAAKGSLAGGKLIYVLSLVVLLLILSVVYLLISRSANDDETPSAHRALRAAPEVARPSPAATSPPKAQATTPEMTGKKNQARKYDEIKERLIAAQYQQAQQGERPPTSQQQDSRQTANSDQVAAIYQQRPQTSARPDKRVAASPPAMQKAMLENFPTLSFIGDLPYSAQKKIPTIMYSAHNYQAQNATVTLNNVVRRKGQQIAADLYLEDILEDGIVIRHGSRRIKMHALNSWVNM